MPERKELAIEYLKRSETDLSKMSASEDFELYDTAIRAWVRDKDYSTPALREILSRPTGIHLVELFQRMVLRLEGDVVQGTRPVMQYALKRALSRESRASDRTNSALEPYSSQDRTLLTYVDSAISRSVSSTPRPSFNGVGAAGQLVTGTVLGNIDLHLIKVPIAIIGAGASGSMVARMLIGMGWDRTKVTMFEKKKTSGGLWAQENVNARSRNNPRKLAFYGHILEAAPGGGAEVFQFASSNLSGASAMYRNAEVYSIRPSLDSFNHQLVLDIKGEKVEEFPIVINCAGIGAPKAYGQGKITYDGTPGIRWQQNISAEQAHRKHFTLVGLGNSTAEMMIQLEAHLQQGVDLDYSVLTHYPEDAIQNPNDTVPLGGKSFRVFRDLNLPNLTGLTGDLPAVRTAYYRALAKKRIQSGVCRMTANGPGAISALRRPKGRRHSSVYYHSPDAAQLYSLIGYGHGIEDYDRMGIHTTLGPHQTPYPTYDYDGEFQSDSYIRGRLYKGYFGLGPILDCPENRNSVVIPGNIHRAGDLGFSVVMRALEYLHKQGEAAN